MGKSKKCVTIYTDGACSGNPGPGGWGVVLIYGDHKKELSGAMQDTTNNRMELVAVISGLQALKEPCAVDLYTDSAYVHNAFSNGWLDNWLRNGWKTSAKKDVINQDLWKQLLSLTNVHNVTFHKVKGHADNDLNNRCDQLAREAVANLKND
ncbi:MAG: ribonuclease HI [Clostridia bacterium]|nr:ribonuclease HI [Clostridia bacterium]